MADTAQELLASLCFDLRLLWRQAGGPSLRVLSGRLELSKSQLGAILTGRVRRPPDWVVVRGLVDSFDAYARDHGRRERVSLRTAVDEYWRPRYATLEHAFSQPPPVRDDPPRVGPAPPPLDQQIRYAVSDGLQIAYQTTGGGRRDIVLVAGFVSHLELDWAEPRHAGFLDRLGSLGRLIRFDKRGTGMSDRPHDVPDAETRMHDVLAVMDAAGSRRAVLFGYSEGGPMSILMAAMHPERVEALVLYGTWARRLYAHDYPWAPTPQQRQQYMQQLTSQWAWEADMRAMCPSADEQMARWWGQRCRAAATPSTVRSLIAMNSLIDVRDALGSLRVPTLVLHRRGDRDSRVEEGRYLAEHIPGARFVELSGVDHFVAVDADQILDEVQRFLADLGSGVAPPRALGAILAVSGPGLVSGSLLSGRRAHTPRGKTVVVYDGPAIAIRDALSVLRGPAGKHARFGLQIAEVPRTGSLVDGPGVEAAVGLAERATPGQLLVSRAVHDLVAGSGVSLAPAGNDAYQPTLSKPSQAPGVLTSLTSWSRRGGHAAH